MTKTAIRSKEAQKKPSMFKRAFGQLQKIGKALLFPIAMMPFAAIFLRIGGGQVFGNTSEFATIVNGIMGAIGAAVFDNLAMLFAIGVAFGLAKDNRGEAAIIGFITYLLLTQMISSSKLDLVGHVYKNLNLGGDGQGTAFHKLFSSPATNQASGFKDSYDSILINNVLAGITVGSVVAFVYNKFSGLEMPSILGFFSGRRLIPVLALIAGVVTGILWAIIFPWIGAGLFFFSDALVSAKGNRWANAGVMGVYGTINRLLIPFGLHHVPNTLFWFSSLGGSQTNPGGAEINGDIFIFLKGAPQDAFGVANTSGTFQAGFFPVMMFGLPALAAAIWFRAKGDVQKQRVAALFAGSAIVSFFTGITEPIEFTFMFMAPGLFAMHAVLTGVVGFVVGVMGIQLGFGFSAGFIDYLLSYTKSMDIIHANKTGFDAFMANPLWIWVIGAGTAAAYFFLGSFLIKKFDWSTPGRGENLLGNGSEEASKAPIAEGSNKFTADSKVIIKAMGGKANIKSLGNCATRLRFVLKDNTKVNKASISNTKAMGSMKVTGGYQVIMGPTVEMYANEIQSLLAATTVKKPAAKKAAPKKAKA